MREFSTIACAFGLLILSTAVASAQTCSGGSCFDSNPWDSYSSPAPVSTYATPTYTTPAYATPAYGTQYYGTPAFGTAVFEPQPIYPSYGSFMSPYISNYQPTFSPISYAAPTPVYSSPVLSQPTPSYQPAFAPATTTYSAASTPVSNCANGQCTQSSGTFFDASFGF